MIVEIAGPPGVGKTTIAAQLDDLPPDPEVPLLSFAEYQILDREIGEAAIMKKGRLERWLSLAPLCWRRPRLVGSMLMLTLLHGRPFLRRARKAQRLLAHTLFTEKLQARFPEKVVVHHDGFVQCLWSTLIDSRSLGGQRLIRSIIRDYHERVQPHLILLEIDDAMAASRVFERTSKGRFNRDSSPKQRSEFGRWLGYHRELVSLVPAALDVTRIDASTPSDMLAQQVFNALCKKTSSIRSSVSSTSTVDSWRIP
jgi:hypothetical protein